MSTTPRRQPRLCGVHHVKLPVADVQASRDWYCRVLGFQLELDFVEDGTLMGVGLSHPGGLRLGLRCDRDRTAALVGFDPLALAVPGHAELDAWLAHLDALGVPYGPVMHGRQGEVVAVHDPDGIQIRLYTIDPPR
jgi:catechol 2,3-dioxygenase-like lactoylglutathione lyase family enzyme